MWKRVIVGTVVVGAFAVSSVQGGVFAFRSRGGCPNGMCGMAVHQAAPAGMKVTASPSDAAESTADKANTAQGAVATATPEAGAARVATRTEATPSTGTAVSNNYSGRSTGGRMLFRRWSR